MHSVIGVSKKKTGLQAAKFANLQASLLYLIENTLWRGNIYKTFTKQYRF